MGTGLINCFPRGHFSPLFNLLDPVITAADWRRKTRTPSSTADQYRARGAGSAGRDDHGLSARLPAYEAPAPWPPTSGAAGAGSTGASHAATTASLKVAIDLDAAIEHLQEKAQPKSLGFCARYVRQAINAGGLTLSSQPGSAKHYGPPLVAAGYSALPAAGTAVQRGDIFVMQPANGPQGHGHIAMHDGTVWISDFKQRDMWGGPTARKVKPSYVIYRP